MTETPEDAKADAYEFELRVLEGAEWGPWQKMVGRRLPIICDNSAEVRNPVPLVYASAVLAERERCARAAELRGKELREPAIGSDIANTIRGPVA